MFISKPKSSEYNPFYEGYVSKVPECNILDLLTENQGISTQIFSEISEQKANFSYAKGKWTIKELLGHIIDTERVFAFRLFWFLRKSEEGLPSFDQDKFMANSNFANQTLKSLLEEWQIVRASTLFLVKNISEKSLSDTGIMGGNSVSIRALLYIIAGHEIHHIQILRERYL